MASKTIIGVVIAVALLLALGAWFAFFAPKGTTQVEQDLAAVSSGEATELASAAWQDADSFHKASGTLQVLQDDDGPFLFFSDFEATAGPDVYLFLSTTPDGDYATGERVRVPVAGGAEDGQATLRGDFRVDLPAGIDVEDYRSAILWCEDFGVLFGTASF